MFKKIFGGSSKDEKEKKKVQKSRSVDESRSERRASEPKKEKNTEASASEKKPKPKPAPASASDTKKRRKRSKKTVDLSIDIDTSQPLEYPCTPEMIIAYHQKKPFLTANEEWLVVELNEYECLVDCEDIIKLIAKHSKFFEIDPPELWEEFFEYVEDMPAYDEVINNDVWQDFRDDRYPC